MAVRRRTVLAAVCLVFLLLVVFYIASSLGGVPPACGLCGGTSPHCDTESGLCGPCGSDADCANSPDGPLCYPSGACSTCRGTAEGCPPGLFCQGGTQCVECRPGYNTDCSGNPNGPICGDNNKCVNCRGNSDCGGAAPYCDTSANRCVACLSSQNCSGLTPFCGDSICVACDPGDPLSCEAGYCVDSGGAPACAPCVEGDPTKPCADGSYCVSDGDSGSTCVECVDGDPERACAPGFTCQGGQCRKACKNSSDCGGSTPNCIDGVCVACASSSTCETHDPLFPVCASGLCVQCNTDSEGVTTGCDGNPQAPVCYSNSCQQCSPANGNGDCVGNPAGPFCLKTGQTDASDAYTCVACLSGADCDDPTRPFCGDAHTCVACLGDGDCGGESCVRGVCVSCGDGLPACPAGTVCSGDGRCIECATDDDCANSLKGPRCTPSGKCGVCSGDADCADPAAPRCAGGSACVQCTDSVDCTDPARPYCDSASNKCVACSSEFLCPDATPVCLGDRCVECTSPDDCGGNACVGNVCGNCGKNCDCGDTNANYCDGGMCRTLPGSGGCWYWKKWTIGPHVTPNDDAFGDPDYLAVVGRSSAGEPWYFGRMPRVASPNYHYMSGNKAGNTGKQYHTTTLYPDEGYYWYLAKAPGCSRPKAFSSGTPIRFSGTSVGVDTGTTVCATANGPSYFFSAPDDKGKCGPPTKVGNFTPISPVSYGYDDC